MTNTSSSASKRELAAMSLTPISKRLKGLIKWGAFDRLIFEMLSDKIETPSVFQDQSFDYKKIFPIAIFGGIAVGGLVTGSFLSSLVVPASFFAVYFVRKKEIEDQIEVIGRLPEVKSGIYHCLKLLHEDNNEKPGYNIEYVQPMIVDYFKSKKEILTGRQIFNIYLELSYATGEKANIQNLKKVEFSKIIGIDNDEVKPVGLEFLETPPDETYHIDNELNEVQEMIPEIEDKTQELEAKIENKVEEAKETSTEEHKPLDSSIPLIQRRKLNSENSEAKTDSETEEERKERENQENLKELSMSIASVSTAFTEATEKQAVEDQEDKNDVNAKTIETEQPSIITDEIDDTNLEADIDEVAESMNQEPEKSEMMSSEEILEDEADVLDEMDSLLDQAHDDTISQLEDDEDLLDFDGESEDFVPPDLSEDDDSLSDYEDITDDELDHLLKDDNKDPY